MNFLLFAEVPSRATDESSFFAEAPSCAAYEPACFAEAPSCVACEPACFAEAPSCAADAPALRACVPLCAANAPSFAVDAPILERDELLSGTEGSCFGAVAACADRVGAVVTLRLPADYDCSTDRGSKSAIR